MVIFKITVGKKLLFNWEFPFLSLSVTQNYNVVREDVLIMKVAQ